MKKMLIAAVSACLMILAPTTQAQWVVIDPTNLAQNIMTAANTLEQINNQIKQLQNDALMLTNQAKNLASLDFNSLGQLRAALSATNQLIQQAQGLAFNVSQMESDFQRLYPASYSAAISGSQMTQDAQTRWQNSLAALHTATQVQSQAMTNFSSDEQTLTDLVNNSQSASGALQATQATNQLLALQARQSIQAQQLKITQDRAAALELARQAAVEARGLEVSRRFLGTGTPYTPQPVDFYNH
jgi:P-type conjugative transfer protein TrbJ